jgi:hypothetical protein
MKTYIVQRDSAAALSADSPAILNLKKLLHQDQVMARAYEFTSAKLLPEEREVLEKDYREFKRDLARSVASLKEKQRPGK